MIWLKEKFEKQPQELLQLMMAVLFTYYAIVPIVAIVRLHRISGMAYFYKGMSLLSLALCTYVVLRWFKDIRWNALSILLVVMLLQGLSIGFANQNPLPFILSHTFNASLALFFCLAFSNFPPEKEAFDRQIKLACIAIGVVALGAMAYFLTFMLNRNFYYGMSVAALMLPLGYCLVSRRWLLAIAILVLITLSGKRGVMIAAFIETGVFLCTLYYDHIKRYQKNILSGFLIAVPSLLIFMALFEVHPLIAKWNIINPLSSTFNLERGSGGRWTEIMRSYEAFQTYRANWIWGAGHGFHYDWWSVTGLWQYDPIRHYMHFSPLNILFRYGLVTGGLFFALLIGFLINGYRELKERTLSQLQATLFLFVVGRLAQGLTSYTWGTDPLLWVAIGYLSPQLLPNQYLIFLKRLASRIPIANGQP